MKSLTYSGQVYEYLRKAVRANRYPIEIRNRVREIISLHCYKPYTMISFVVNEGVQLTRS